MKYWTRTTHNFNNETREWEFRKELYNKHYKEKSNLGVHALDCGRWHSLRELAEENMEYYQQYKNNPWGGVNENGYSEDSILHDLSEMEKLGMVKSKGNSYERTSNENINNKPCPNCGNTNLKNGFCIFCDFGGNGP